MAKTNAPSPAELLAGRVLVKTTIGAVEANPDEIVEGVPSAMAESYAGAIDFHPDAVAYAREQGGEIKQYAEAPALD